MKKPIIAILAAATLITPIAAQAHTSRGELRRDRQEIREETRDLRDAQRYGTRADIRDARGEVREARQEYREDLNDRRHYNTRANPLPAPRYGTRYVRYSRDLLLINTRNGNVIRAYRGFYR